MIHTEYSWSLGSGQSLLPTAQHSVHLLSAGILNCHHHTITTPSPHHPPHHPSSLSLDALSLETTQHHFRHKDRRSGREDTRVTLLHVWSGVGWTQGRGVGGVVVVGVVEGGHKSLSPVCMEWYWLVQGARCWWCYSGGCCGQTWNI